MSRKRRKQTRTRSHQICHPAPETRGPYRVYLVIAVGVLILGVGLFLGFLSQRKPKALPPSRMVSVSNTPHEEKTVDWQALLFGEANTVAQIKAEALKLGQSIISHFPESDAALFLLGSVYGQQGDVDRNIALWQQVIRLNPKHPNVYTELAQLVKEQGDMDQAVTYWQQGLDINPRQADTLWQLANTYLEMHQPERAVDLLVKACALAPKSMRNYYLLGQAYRQLQHFNEACVQYEKVIEMDPSHFNAYYGLAQACRSLKQMDRAKECLSKFQALKKTSLNHLPENIMVDDLPQNLKHLARCYYQSYAIYKAKNQPSQGLPLLRRAIALDPSNTYYQEILGVYFMQNRQFARAITVYEKARVVDPNRPLFGVNIGKLYIRMNQPAQAERVFLQMINDFPDYALSYAELSRHYLKAQRNLTKTVGLTARAVALQPSPGNYHLLAWAHDVNGQYGQAIEAIQEAMALAPTNNKYRALYDMLKKKSQQ